MILDFGFSYPNYLAHFTIGFGRKTLWFSIIASNWKSISHLKAKDKLQVTGAHFSVFTVAYTGD
jgi:hypothetical protein